MARTRLRKSLYSALADGPAPVAAAKAKSVILLWMNGGPSHLDTWDPKPGTSVGGPFKALKTSTAGLSVSEHMPKLAALANKLSVLRMASKEGNHQRAQYLNHTGYAPNPTLVHPSLGGWMSKKLGPPAGGLPASNTSPAIKSASIRSATIVSSSQARNALCSRSRGRSCSVWPRCQSEVWRTRIQPSNTIQV